MNTSKVLGIGAVVVAVAGAGLVAHQQRENARHLEDRVEQLSRALEKGTKRIDAIDGAANINRALALAARERADQADSNVVLLGELPASPEEGGSEANVSDEGTPTGDPTSTRPGSAPVELVLANMEANFESEAPDTTAARSADTIREDVAHLLSPGSSIESIDCRTSMCRLESVQEDLDAYRAFISKVTNSDTCRECFFTQTGETSDQRPKLTLYLARANHSLPRME